MVFAVCTLVVYGFLMDGLRIGIVGTGSIARAMVSAIEGSEFVVLRAAASRSRARAESFLASVPGAQAFDDWTKLVASSDVDAVYIAVPTTLKEPVAMAALSAGKHVIVEKPLVNAASAERLAHAAQERGLALMDGTQFVHHPRTAQIQGAQSELIGPARSLHTVVYFPQDSEQNIRFDPSLEPTGAVGDAAWYCMRAAYEYLRPGAIRDVFAVAEWEAEAVVRVSGILSFDCGATTTFDAGFTAESLGISLDLVGRSGMISMDDFVFDWRDSLPFRHPERRVGYKHRRGMVTEGEPHFIETPSEAPQEVLMFDHLHALIQAEEGSRVAQTQAMIMTQLYVDAIWRALAGVPPLAH